MTAWQLYGPLLPLALGLGLYIGSALAWGVLG